MKNLYFVRINGYDMVVSVDENKNCRYLTETSPFPELPELRKEDVALDFLKSIEDDSSWADDCNYEQIMSDDNEIIAKIEGVIL